MELNLNSIDFQYTFDCEWDNYTSCNCGDDYCRCSTIDDPRMNDFKIIDVVDSIYTAVHGAANTKKDKRNKTIKNVLNGNIDVDRYFIYRILVIDKVFGDQEMWDFGISQGYYGEEMNYVSINSSTSEIVEEHVNKMVGLATIKEKMDYCLALEYGGVLTDDVKNAVDYEVIEISLDEISHRNLNQQHIKKVKSDENHYHDYPKELPRGLVKETPVGYHIIDGYHRMFGIKDSSEKFRVYLLK